MLKIIRVNLLVKNPIFVDKDNIVDKIDDNEVVRAKIGTKMAKSKSKSKNKNLAKLFFTKS